MIDFQCCRQVKVSCLQMEGTHRVVGNVEIIAAESTFRKPAVISKTCVGHMRQVW